MPLQVGSSRARDPTFENERTRRHHSPLHGIDGGEMIAYARLNPGEVASPFARDLFSLSFGLGKLVREFLETSLHAPDRRAHALSLELVGK